LSDLDRRRRLGLLADGKLQKRFLSFLRQVRDHIEERGLVGPSDIVDPISGTPNAISSNLRMLSNSFGLIVAQAGTGTAVGCGGAISWTRSRISTSCMAPVVGCRSIRRRSAQA
jgi:hypothetical protein